MTKLDEYSLQNLADQASREGTPVWRQVILAQMNETGESETALRQKMAGRLRVMREAIEQGRSQPGRSHSGLSGGDALRHQQAARAGKLLGGTMQSTIVVYALAVAETNAQMGRIVAAPTAGAAGVIPAVLLAAAEQHGYSDDRLLEGLFTAAAVGAVIASRASLSGAEGGCQAECGSAAGMAAAALVEIAGGSPHQAIHACALAIKGHLGLVCDPVAGLVEVPCVKRNAFSAVQALTAADMALAGIESYIPPDEVLDAMRSIGRLMHPDLKETARGGLAATTTGRKAAEEMMREKLS